MEVSLKGVAEEKIAVDFVNPQGELVTVTCSFTGPDMLLTSDGKCL